MNTTCNSCESPSPGTRKSFGIMTGLLLALLPKCPFCVMAFTGTALLCGEGSVIEVSRTHNSLLTIVITGVLCLLTLVGIALNRRGNRTWYALAFASAGMAMIMYSVLRRDILSVFCSLAEWKLTLVCEEARFVAGFAERAEGGELNH
jgi:hypothetical protein